MKQVRRHGHSQLGFRKPSVRGNQAAHVEKSPFLQLTIHHKNKP